MAAMPAHAGFALADPIDCEASCVKALGRRKFSSADDAVAFDKNLQPECAYEPDFRHARG
jgi:hypothetical protein